VDPEVISANNLKLNSLEAISVIKTINQIGSFLKNGIPALLPGINLIHGLLGENQKTFALNYEFLKEVLNSGLLLRRINIRQAVHLPGTMLARNGPKQNSKIFNKFLFYKEKIREEIDRPMLSKIFPIGARIPDVLIEKNEGEVSLGRQLASYPITCKFHKRLALHKPVDAIVIGHQERSVNAIAQEIDVNQVESAEIQRFPGIGKSKKMDWIMNRPYQSLKDFLNTVQPGTEFEPLKKYLRIVPS
jgi:radical SAM superfamily enzyme with C-terminal helix-hairpin-helix motif